jgi:protein crumbs
MNATVTELVPNRELFSLSKLIDDNLCIYFYFLELDENIQGCLQNCSNKGLTYNDAYQNYQCICDQGYKGEMCNQLSNPCLAKNTCINNGTCSLDNSNPKGFVCTCPPIFHGEHCENRFNICANFNCSSQGLLLCLFKIF